MHRYPSCQALATDGFVHLNGVLADDEVLGLLRLSEPFHTSAFSECTTHPRESIPYSALVLNHPEFGCLIDRPEVLRPVVALLGPCIHLVSSELWMRKSQTESEEYAEGAHRDGGFLMHHLPCVMQVKVQFFLTPLHSRRMGNIGFIRKSHLWTGLPDSLPPEQLERDRFVVTASAGDAVLWTNRTLHFVEGNDSGYDRMSVILTYSPIWSRPFDYVAAPEHVLEQFGPLQRLLVGADGREFCRAKYYNPPSDYYRRYISSLTEALGPLSDCFEPAGSLYNFAPGSPTPRLEVIPVT